jgi:hypothetical protein
MRAIVITLALSAVVSASVKGWFLSGSGHEASEYEMGIDRDVVHSGRASAYLKSIAQKPQEAALMQMISADRYRGKRVRISAWIKTERVDAMAAVGARVESADGRGVYAYGREELKGTNDWQRREVVLDVDPAAARIALGMGLWGTGQAWIDDVNVDIVDRSVPTTDKLPHFPVAPSNLDFEE